MLAAATAFVVNNASIIVYTYFIIISRYERPVGAALAANNANEAKNFRV
jgi:hypothetical protein